MGGGDDDEGTSSKGAFRESPYDHEVTKKVKRAATEIDKFRFVIFNEFDFLPIFLIDYF